MTWYEHQPFLWILENLSTVQIMKLIAGIMLMTLLITSYYVYLDTIQSIRNNTQFFSHLRNFSIVLIVVFVFWLFCTFELTEILG